MFVLYGFAHIYMKQQQHSMHTNRQNKKQQTIFWPKHTCTNKHGNWINEVWKIGRFGELDQIWSNMHFGVSYMWFESCWIFLIISLYLFPINIYCQLYAMNAFFLADTGPINPIPFTFPLRTIISTASHNIHIHSSNCGPWQSVVLYSTWNHFRCFIQQFRGVGYHAHGIKTRQNARYKFHQLEYEWQVPALNGHEQKEFVSQTLGIAIGNM